MCGIAGFIAKSEIDFVHVLTDMNKALFHRGPDSNGIWYSAHQSIGLSHTRLSIIDLSKAGHQPMKSMSGRYIIVFNGEIYNHQNIRKELAKIGEINWIGTSDTETLLAAIEQWGVDRTIEKCIGMFAIALWDIKKASLTLIRDRMGEKPLYYGWVNGSFVFGSELKALKKFPTFNNKIDRNALALYLRHSSIPEPYSIYENIYKLESGCSVILEKGMSTVTNRRYWSVEKIANFNDKSVNNTITDENDAVIKLESLLMDSVGLQMQADVPTGAFLSGGVDSSIIASLMQEQSTRKINTFTIGFENQAYNEAEYAKTIAKHLGTNHHETYVNGQDALDIIPSLPNIYCEPFSEASQIPTFLVSKMARQEVTVSLSGDAGDELFCGYNRYHLAQNTWRKISIMPRFLRSGMSSTLECLPDSFWTMLLKPFNRQSNALGQEVNVTDKLLKAIPLLKAKNRQDFYHKGFMSHNLEVEKWILDSNVYKTIFDENSLELNSYLAEMMSLDLMTYLPNNNLTKVDRAAMAVSLETRVPLLDHRVVSYAMSLPNEYKLRNGVDKWVLREVLYKYVPRKMIERPKMGFGVPLADWLRGPLREWGEVLLNKKRLDEEGIFNTEIIRKKWEEHLSGTRNWHYQIWDILVFQAWLEKQK